MFGEIRCRRAMADLSATGAHGMGPPWTLLGQLVDVNASKMARKTNGTCILLSNGDSRLKCSRLKEVTLDFVSKVVGGDQ